MKANKSCPTLCNLKHSPGQNTEAGSLSILQGIFPTQESNPCVRHCRRSLYQLSHKRSPTILEWVTYPFFQGIFLTQGSNPCLLQVSCIAGRYFITKLLRKPDCMFCLFCSVAKSCLALCDPTDYMGSSGKNTRMCYHFLLQGIFLTQGSNPGLLHFRQVLCHLSHQGSQGKVQ